MAYGNKDLHQLAFEKDRSIVGETVARKSKLMALLRPEKGHEGVKLDRDAFDRLVTWMDVYAQARGHYTDRQEAELRELRKKMSGLLSE
jgi:hypothetical protein